MSEQNLKGWCKFSLLVQIFWRLISQKILYTLVHGTSITLHLGFYAVEIIFRCSGVNNHCRSSGIALQGLGAA